MLFLKKIKIRSANKIKIIQFHTPIQRIPVLSPAPKTMPPSFLINSQPLNGVEISSVPEANLHQHQNLRTASDPLPQNYNKTLFTCYVPF